jgi:DHA1 family tetracycline resistance protein-like MFS transporter
MPARLAARLAGARALDRPIAVLALIAFVSQVGVGVMLPLLPLYAIHLGATPPQLSLMVSMFALTNAVGQLGSGFLIGRLSPRRQIPVGQAAYAAANLAIAAASDALGVISFRAVSGFGGGLAIVAERVYIARVADRARLAFTNGVISAAGSSGSVLGPVIGSVLALTDLRLPFVVVGTTAGIAAIASFSLLPAEDAHVGPDHLARSRVVDAGVAAVAAAEGAASRRWSAMRPLAAIGAWSLFFNAAYGAWITTLAQFATVHLSMTASGVSLMFAGFGVGSIAFGPPLARIADRTGRRRMVAIGTLLVVAGGAVMLARAPLIAIYAVSFVIGAGIAAAQSSWFALLTVATDGARRGRSFGNVTALSNLGVIGGASLAGAVWSAVGLPAGFAVSIGFALVATVSLALVADDRPRLAAPALA